MKSNYKRLGNYIKESNIRNGELKASKLLGINIDKFFMPSVANIVGTDMSVYKIVKKGQFACNRMHVGRDYRLPIALSNLDEDFMVSPAYDVFEVIDPKELVPEYLMMWFSRKEFDRNAWFYTDADVRGGLPWKSFCDMQLPIPHPDKQRELVKEYNTIANRINLNNQLIEKLEETAQAIYKQWFVDFEFPDENGQPYKSSGGEMEWCEELRREVPKGWFSLCLKEITDHKKGYAFKSHEYRQNGIPVIRVSDLTAKSISIDKCLYINSNITEEVSQYKLRKNDLIITTVGSWPDNPASVVGKLVIVPGFADGSLLNQNTVRLRAKDKNMQICIYYHLNNKDYSDYIISGAQGSANQASVTLDHIFSYKIIIPNNPLKINKFLATINNHSVNINTEIYTLSLLKSILLSSLK